MMTMSLIKTLPMQKRLSSYMKIRILMMYLLLFISLRGYGQCTLTVTLSQSSPAICSGTGVVLTATPKGGTPALFIQLEHRRNKCINNE